MPKVRDPSMPLYVADWLSSEAVTAMTLEQQGAFLRLLAHAWLSGSCSLPDNDTALAALSTLGDRWAGENAEVLRRCFKKKRIGNETRIANEKLAKIWKDKRNYAERGREGGLKSGEARRSESKLTRSKPPSKREAKSNSTSTSSITSSSSESIIDVSLKRITPEVLADTGALLAWLEESAKSGGCSNSEHSQIQTLALAERCIERGKKPGGAALFVSMFRDGKFDHLNGDDIDAASKRLREFRRGEGGHGIDLSNIGRIPE